MTPRDSRRRARRDLKTAGCTCHPTIIDIPTKHVAAVGARAGFLIKHEAGCVLGDTCLADNRAGRLGPPIITYGCGR